MTAANRFPTLALGRPLGVVAVALRPARAAPAGERSQRKGADDRRGSGSGRSGNRQRQPLPRALMKMRFRPTAFLAALAVSVLAAPPTAALTFLADENPPYNYTDKGKLAGSSTEIVRDMALRAGLPVKTEVLPWDKAYVRAQGERETCLFSTARFENRERLFLWIGPIGTGFWAVYGKGDFALPIRAVKDLSPYRIGTMARDPKNEFLRENGVTDLRPARDDAQNPARLLLPREHPDHIDLWITDLYAGRDAAKAAKVSDVKLVFVAGEQPLFLACNPQLDRKVVKALADALDGMKADGSYGRITADYEKRFPR
jgi:polar amino acid transport system substrate-binding protein